MSTNPHRLRGLKSLFHPVYHPVSFKLLSDLECAVTFGDILEGILNHIRFHSKFSSNIRAIYTEQNKSRLT